MYGRHVYHIVTDYVFTTNGDFIYETFLRLNTKIGEKFNIELNVTEAKRITLEKSKLTIIVSQLENKDMRNKLILNSKNNKLNAKMLVTNWLENIKIFINEPLTKNKRILFEKTRSTAKEKNYKFVWITNAEILIRKDESSRISHTRASNDPQKI
ncbi:hypothetical protein QTP88_019792 [Uroleucon formosanum]